MQNKVRQLTKIGILIIGVALFLTNCEKDDTTIEQNVENNFFLTKVKQKNIAFDNLKLDGRLNQILEYTLDNSKNETVSKLFNKSKTTNNSSQFDSNVTNYTLGDYTSYTIPIKNTTGDLSSFQNIVIEADNVREASYLITYYPDESYQEFIRLGYIRNGADIDFSGNSEIEVLYYKGKVPTTSIISSTNKSNQKNSNLSQKSSGDVSCKWSCFTVHTPPSNCTAGGNHTPEEIDACEGSSGQLPSSGEIQAYCFEYDCTTGGGVPSDGSGNEPSLEGETTGSFPFDPVQTPDDWTPEYICTAIDPINGNCTKIEPYTPIITRADIPNDLGFELYSLLDIEIGSETYNWLETHDSDRISINALLTINRFSNEAITESNMRISTEMVNDTDPVTLQWDYTKTGIYLNRETLKYKASVVIPGTFDTEKMYLLENDLVLYVADGKKKINKDSISLPPSEPSDDGYHYIYSFDTKQYYEYRIPPTSFVDADIDFLLDAFWTGTKIVARYATPLEDAIILIDGKDFDDVEQNQAIAGGMILVSIVPGGKILKPIAKVAKGTTAWKIASKVGSKTVTLSFKIVNGAVHFGSRSKLAQVIKITFFEEAHHIIPWNKLDNEVIQEAAYAGFHMNAEVNGKALQKFTKLTGEGIHGNHPQYDIYIEKLLSQFKTKNLGFTSEQAKDFLEKELIPELDNLIELAKGSNLNLNEYFRLLN